MTKAVDRLSAGAAVLGVIDRRRAETGDDRLGADIERMIIYMQLQELQAEILENPGAFESWLVGRRRVG